MASRKGPASNERIASPNSLRSNQGQEALNSMITQYNNKIKELESQNSFLNERLREKEVQIVLLKNSQPVPTALGRKKLDLPRRSRLDLVSHSSGSSSSSSSSAVLNLDTKTATDSKKRGEDSFCSDIFEGKLSSEGELKKKFQDLATVFGQKLVQLADLQTKKAAQESEINQNKDLTKSILKFFRHLEVMCRDHERSNLEIPVWLYSIPEKASSSTKYHIANTWKLLHYALHLSCDDSEKPSALTQQDADKWYANCQSTEPTARREDLENASINLYKLICTDLRVIQERDSEGLSLSIIPGEISPDESSNESSLSTKIPATELWQVRTIFQGLVEKVEDLRNTARLKGSGGSGADDFDDMNDMYLPPRDALETYDLGKLLKLMNSVIQDLSLKVTSLNEEKRLCQRCQQDIDLGISPSSAAWIKPHGNGPSSELHSRETAAQPSIPRPLQLLSSNSGGTIPKVAGRPHEGVFRGISGPLPPRQLTVLQNSSHHQRSELSSSLLRSKPNSVDSVFRRPGSSGGVTPPARRFALNIGPNQSFSDDDEDYEIRGPPDTPPEVRAMEGMQINRTDRNLSALHGQVAHLRQRSGDSGVDISQPHFDIGLRTRPESQDRFATPYSQVQQCTGDNSKTRQDMLLPSSVEWSTVQLKQGGMASPTLEAMGRFSSSMHLAEKSIKNRQCTVCKIPFPDKSPADIYEHIQSHLVQRSPESSLAGGGMADAVVDGLVTMTAGSTGLSQVLLERDCPVCHINFPEYVPLKAIESHINLHFDENAGSFEVVDENFRSTTN